MQSLGSPSACHKSPLHVAAGQQGRCSSRRCRYCRLVAPSYSPIPGPAGRCRAPRTAGDYAVACWSSSAAFGSAAMGAIPGAGLMMVVPISVSTSAMFDAVIPASLDADWAQHTHHQWHRPGTHRHETPDAPNQHSSDSAWRGWGLTGRSTSSRPMTMRAQGSGMYSSQMNLRGRAHTHTHTHTHTPK